MTQEHAEEEFEFNEIDAEYLAQEQPEEELLELADELLGELEQQAEEVDEEPEEHIQILAR